MSIAYRKAIPPDATKLSILFKQVYIATYGTAGVSDEFANFISQRFSIANLAQMIDDDAHPLFVATYQNNLVGAAEIGFGTCPIGRIVAPELNKLYILEWFCGQGVGEQLLAMAEQHVWQQGHTQMWLWVLESNARAIGFYKKHGYKEIGNAPFQMEVNRYENIVMVKDCP